MGHKILRIKVGTKPTIETLIEEVTFCWKFLETKKTN
jgi:hypothetical protein